MVYPKPLSSPTLPAPEPAPEAVLPRTLGTGWNLPDTVLLLEKGCRKWTVRKWWMVGKKGGEPAASTTSAQDGKMVRPYPVGIAMAAGHCGRLACKECVGCKVVRA